MKTKTIIASFLLLITAGAASANEYDTTEATSAVQAPLTRASVKAALLDALAKGEIVSGELYGSFPAHASGDAPPLSRDQVKAELRVAQANGEIVSGELYPELPSRADRIASHPSRLEVKTSTIAYARLNSHRAVDALYSGG